LDERLVRRKAVTCTQDNTNTEKTHTQTFMPEVGFEHSIPVFEGTKRVHALDRAATMIS
jgi:hypothetical protein